MKILKATFLSLLLSTTALAANFKLTGSDAQDFMAALEKAGAFENSTADKINTSANDIVCAVDTDQTPSVSSCTLRVLNEAGGLTPERLKGKSAKEFTNALADAGLANYRAKSTACSVPLDANADLSESVCVIER